MDADLNKYDLEHVTTAHAAMSTAEWEATYWRAWSAFYSPEHIETVMRRAVAAGISPGKTLFLLMWFWGCIAIEKVHPLQGGYFRRKYRRDRRPPLPLENPLLFYPRYLAEVAWKHLRMGRLIWHYSRVRREIKRDANRRAYMDQALTPVLDAELETLEMFTSNDAAKAVVEKVRREEQRRTRASA